MKKSQMQNYENSIEKTIATLHGSDISTKNHGPQQHFEKNSLQNKGEKERERAGPQPQHDSIENRWKKHRENDRHAPWEWYFDEKPWATATFREEIVTKQRGEKTRASRTTATALFRSIPSKIDIKYHRKNDRHGAWELKSMKNPLATATFQKKHLQNEGFRRFFYFSTVLGLNKWAGLENQRLRKKSRIESRRQFGCSRSTFIDVWKKSEGQRESNDGSRENYR